MEYSICAEFNVTSTTKLSNQSTKGVGMIAYTSLLLVIGIPGNIISGIFMGTDSSNRLTTRILMVALSVGDTSVLITAIFLRYWIRSISNWDIRMYSNMSCKLHGCMSGFCRDFAFFALCGIAVERFIVVAFPRRSHYIVTVKNVIIVTSILTAMLFIKNVALIHFTNFDAVKRSCKQDLLSWKIGDFVSFAVIPSVILFFCNAFILIILKRRRRALKISMKNCVDSKADQLKKSMLAAIKQQNNSKKMNESSHPSAPEIRRKRKPENVIKVILGLTLIHAVCTVPGTVLQVLMDYVKMSREACQTSENIKYALIMLIFTNNAINFFVYLVTCIGFRHKMIELFKPISTLLLSLCSKNDSFTSGMSRFSSMEVENNTKLAIQHRSHDEPVKLVLATPYGHSDNSKSDEDNLHEFGKVQDETNCDYKVEVVK